MNDSEYIIKLTRLEVCDLMLACTHVKWDAINEMKNDPDCPQYRREVVLPATVAKWGKLHDKVEAQLHGCDANSIFSELVDQFNKGNITKEELQTEMGRRVGFLL